MTMCRSILMSPVAAAQPAFFAVSLLPRVVHHRLSDVVGRRGLADIRTHGQPVLSRPGRACPVPAHVPPHPCGRPRGGPIRPPVDPSGMPVHRRGRRSDARRGELFRLARQGRHSGGRAHPRRGARLRDANATGIDARSRAGRPLPRAVAWSTSSAQTAFIVGPALGGLLYTAGRDPGLFDDRLSVPRVRSARLSDPHGAEDREARAGQPEVPLCGHCLHPEQTGHFRRHIPRPLRRLARRRHGPAARLRPENPRCRPGGIGGAPLGARRRRLAHVPLPRPPSPQTPDGQDHVHGRHRLRGRDRRLRPLVFLPPVPYQRWRLSARRT